MFHNFVRERLLAIEISIRNNDCNAPNYSIIKHIFSINIRNSIEQCDIENGQNCDIYFTPYQIQSYHIHNKKIFNKTIIYEYPIKLATRSLIFGAMKSLHTSIAILCRE